MVLGHIDANRTRQEKRRRLRLLGRWLSGRGHADWQNRRADRQYNQRDRQWSEEGTLFHR